MPDSKARPNRPAWLRVALAFAAVGTGAVAGLALCLGWLTTAMEAPGPMGEARTIVAPHGTTAELADELGADGLVERPLILRAAVWLTRGEGPLHAGEFAFPAHASVNQVLGILRSGKPVEHLVTIAEGLTARQIQGVLLHAEAMTGEVRPFEEGSVLPQTYAYEYGTDRAAIVARAKAAMDKELVRTWADRAPGLKLSSPRDALILASIVERETAKPDERPHVAAVYLNRLRLGMRLQADPTVVYLASGGAGILDHPLTRAELDRDDPFNTYRSAGLPPAPICSPGAGSLYAVVHPADSEDLYFVADGAGGHIFSRGYAQHDSAVARMRALAPSATHGGSSD
jgi:UPF0755 protein